MRAGLLLVASILAGCAGPGPATRQAVALLGQIDAEDAKREAVLRKQLRNAWRGLALAEHDAALRAQASGDQVALDEALSRLRTTLAQLERADGIIDGFAAEAADSGAQASRLRDALTTTLRELEQRSAAVEQLGDAAAAAAGELGAAKGVRDRARADEAEARRLEAERAAEEGAE
ncbi:MAG: hypothetical protein ACPHCN_14360 [Mycobacterium sp.]